MPNITKYMGRVIPGMSVIQGAWDVGQGVSSLVEALQKRAAKQSGGPMPMEDIGNWLQKNYTPEESFTIDNKTYKLPAGDKPTHERRSYRTKWSNQDPRFSYIEHPRALGMEQKILYDEINSLHSQNTRWDFDVEKMVEALEELKDSKYKNKKNRLKKELTDRLKSYTHPNFGDTRLGIPRAKARDSIWMSVLDAMKRQEKQEKKKK